MAEPGSRNKLSKRKLDKYLKNRDFAQLVEHGRKIAEAIGHAVEADAFNPVIVDFYQTVGYLPEAIINYLALLGWSLDDKTRAFFAAGVDREVFVGAGEQGPGQFRSRRSSRRSRIGTSSSFPSERKDGIGDAVSGKGRADCHRRRRPTQRQTRRKGHCRRRRPDQSGRRHPGSSPISSRPTTNWPTTNRPSKSTFARAARIELLAKFRDRLAAAEPFDAPTLEALMQQFVAAEADQDRPGDSRRAGGRDRQGGRAGAVRFAGDSRERAVFAADRERDRISVAERGYTCALSSAYNGGVRSVYSVSEV